MVEEVIVGYDWKNIQANLLFGLLYEKLGEAGLQRKHFAIAKVKRMRDLHLLPPKSSIPKNLRTTPYESKVEIIDFKTVNTKDQQLPPDQSDSLYLEFVDFLLDNMIYDLADQALNYINDRSTERYLVTLRRLELSMVDILRESLPLTRSLRETLKTKMLGCFVATLSISMETCLIARRATS